LFVALAVSLFSGAARVSSRIDPQVMDCR